MIPGLLAAMLLIVSVFLILLILVQRGRGGGLAGALGGMGGQSAFGTKAGDLFTKVTMGVAAVWIVLCLVSVKLIGGGDDHLSKDLGGSAPTTVDVLPPGETPPGKTAAPDATTPSGGAGSGAPSDGPGGKSQTPPPADEPKSSK